MEVNKEDWSEATCGCKDGVRGSEEEMIGEGREGEKNWETGVLCKRVKGGFPVANTKGYTAMLGLQASHTCEWQGQVWTPFH